MTPGELCVLVATVTASLCALILVCALVAC